MALFENKERGMNKTVSMKRKKTKGRQKIEIKQIQKADQRQVTFSKRRTGLFKKAGELSVLCGAEVAVVVFSEGSKPYTFGHPNVDIVVDKYLNGWNDATTRGMMMMMQPLIHVDKDHLYSSESKSQLSQLNKCYLDAARELEEERQRGRRSAATKCGDGGYLWDEVTEGMCLEELEEYLKAMHEMRSKIVDQLEQASIKEDEELKDVMLWQEIAALDD